MLCSAVIYILLKPSILFTSHPVSYADYKILLLVSSWVYLKKSNVHNVIT